MKTLNNYMLFYGEKWYPGGGWWDFHGCYSTIKKAKKAIPKSKLMKPTWWHIIDVKTMKCVDAHGDSFQGRGDIPNQITNG